MHRNVNYLLLVSCNFTFVIISTIFLFSYNLIFRFTHLFFLYVSLVFNINLYLFLFSFVLYTEIQLRNQIIDLSYNCNVIMRSKFIIESHYLNEILFFKK